MNLIKKQIGFGDGSYDFKFNLELKNEEEFRDYIYKKFPKKKVIEIYKILTPEMTNSYLI
ncbi:hypothetical protein [Mycoplasmopsis bovis]|uniref:hypothetical protein n=1 Tax=Mycoplasmopsis bovis TaxID=28903 RepID=UPI003D270F48